MFGVEVDPISKSLSYKKQEGKTQKMIVSLLIIKKNNLIIVKWF